MKIISNLIRLLSLLYLYLNIIIKEMKNIIAIKNKIISVLENVGKTEYFTIYKIDGTQLKLRVGDHSGNKRNNDVKTLSFVSNRTVQKKSQYNSIIEEWVIDLDNQLTDTFQSIEEVLEWEDVADDQDAAKELYEDSL